MYSTEAFTLIKENESFRTRIESLNKENIRLQNEIVLKKRNLQKVQDYVRYEIIHYFTQCYSLRDTTYQFGFESVGDCYDALIEYCGCSGPAQSAEDYIECYKEIFGLEYEEEKDDTSDNTSDLTSSRDSFDSE
jgi:hypothetical protein